MGLVDDDGVVLRQHVVTVQRIDREHGVVGDDEVSVSGLLTGCFGEALAAEGTALSP